MANRVGKKNRAKRGAGKAVSGKKKISAEGAEGQRTQRNKRSLDSGTQIRRGSARDDKPARDDKALLYLYGISEESAPIHVSEGVDGRSRVEAIECAGLTCWTSRVDAREFGEELQARMENLDWLAGASVRHQRVVGAIHERTTVLPARFATLFLSEKTLAAHVKSGMKQVRADLERVKRADEYGIKVFAVSTSAAAPPATEASGRDYLQRKSLMLRQGSTPTVTPEVEKFVAGLREIAQESAAGGSVSGGQRNLVWQGSFLVARSARRRLESALAQFRQRGEGFRIECTGPWPPYSFIAVKAEKR